VCIVAPHRLVAQYLLSLLGEDPQLQAVPLSPSFNLKAGHGHSILLIDCSGLPLPLCECLTRLRPWAPTARIVVLDEEIMDAHRMVQLGIHGFLPYLDVAASLLPAIRAVAQGKIWARREILHEYMQKNLIAHNGGFGRGAMLTGRETLVMDLVKRRMSNSEIAGILGVRESTIKFHLSNLFSKLQVKTRRDLVTKEEAVELWNMLVQTSQRRESA